MSERSEEQHRLALQRAVEAVPEPTLAASLQAVVEQLPVAVDCDFANLRLLDTEGRLQLVAASGCSLAETRKRALAPLAREHAREMVVSGTHDVVGRSLGIQWLHVVWLENDGEDIGTIAVGSRTKRRPGEAELRLLDEVSRRLAARLETVDRRPAELTECALSLGRAEAPPDWPGNGLVANLRPRERAILELYADGLSTADIADLLVISRHTVRTHVKLAMRRLDVHSRDEAATMVRTDQLAQLL